MQKSFYNEYNQSRYSIDSSYRICRNLQNSTWQNKHCRVRLRNYNKYL